MSGFPINWSMGVGPANILTHPLYMKYSVIELGDIDLATVQADYQAMPLSVETQYIQSYLASLIRNYTLTI